MVNQLYLNMEAENSVVKAQIVGLSHRLQCAEEIINCNNVNGGDDFLKTWDFAPWESEPITTNNISSIIHKQCPGE